MAELVEVDGAEDPRLGDFAALTDAALRKRYEHQHGVLIAEGPNPVRELVTSAYPVRSLLVARERLDDLTDVLAAVDAPAYVVDRPVLETVVRFRLHQGVLACGERLPPADLDQVLVTARRVAVLEGLNDHENLGALFRSARALGIDAVILGPGCADPLYRRSIRVSMGHVLHVAQAWCRDLDHLFDRLAAHGFTTLALTPDPAADRLDGDVEVASEDRLAVLLGAEGPGLSTDALGRADRRGRIVLADAVDSLNVAAAAAIAFHQLGRRRG